MTKSPICSNIRLNLRGVFMKRFLVVLFAFLFGLQAYAEVIEVETIGDMKTFWDRTGKYEQKILDIGPKLLNANKINKRIAFQMIRQNNIINAHARYDNKTVYLYYGIIPYIDNDDELAFVLGHEMTHALDAYGGFFKWTDMWLNSKEYEIKADLQGIDFMAKAGYNPVAAITFANKSMPEDYWDVWLLTSHPKTSKRLMNMYKYIYKKYPWALQSEMTHNVNYENFTYSAEKEIKLYQQHDKERNIDRPTEDL